MFNLQKLDKMRIAMVKKNIFAEINLSNENHQCSHGTVAGTLRIIWENTWTTNIYTP